MLPGGVGQGGNIQLTSGSLVLANGGLISSATSGQGNAGNITIQTNWLDLNGASQSGSLVGIVSVATSESKGNAGNIDIMANSVAVTNGGVVAASTNAQGQAGNVTLQVRDRLLLSGVSPKGQRSAISSETEKNGTGSAGNITIVNPKTIRIENGAGILWAARALVRQATFV
ncbi:MAG: hypothetical protein HC936_19070 [Leptolyngbyaceae cyanobacterium SU_3_3]|nr:hypothetical protein [Leptolyngbyaceae cyanobacterium SU_3_3]